MVLRPPTHRRLIGALRVGTAGFRSMELFDAGTVAVRPRVIPGVARQHDTCFVNRSGAKTPRTPALLAAILNSRRSAPSGRTS